MGGGWALGEKMAICGLFYTMKSTAPPRALRGQGFTGAEPPTEPLAEGHCGYSRMK